VKKKCVLGVDSFNKAINTEMHRRRDDDDDHDYTSPITTWFIWMLLTLIAFFAQISGGAGAGSYVLGLTAAISLVIFVTALVVGRKNIVKVDWLFLAGSILALFLWSVTESPFWSVILITVVDAVAFAPTFRKAWSKPWSETLITYLLSSVKFVFVILNESCCQSRRLVASQADL
jgi:hypothetical protein